MKNVSLDFSTEYCQCIFHAAFHKEMNIYTWFSASGGWYSRITVIFSEASKCYSGLTGQGGWEEDTLLDERKGDKCGTDSPAKLHF